MEYFTGISEVSEPNANNQFNQFEGNGLKTVRQKRIKVTFCHVMWKWTLLNTELDRKLEFIW